MILPGNLGALTYCLNIHPTQSWQKARAAITGPLVTVKQALSPTKPFAAGLRFSADVMAELTTEDARFELDCLLQAHDLWPITMNGVPYGPFHGLQDKENIYLPDWRSPDRLGYTRRLASLLAEINLEGSFITLSTVPGAVRPLGQGAEAAMAESYLQAVAHLVELEARTGRRIVLAIEPAPFCFLETIAEAIAFLETYLFSKAAQLRLLELTRLPPRVAERTLRRHLGLCYNVCHAAVEFEDAAQSIQALNRAGVAVHKLQLSSALRVAEGGEEARRALAAFNEPNYLHQLVSRAPDGALSRFRDLPEALGDGGARDGEEWRVNLSVPLFMERLPQFETTQSFLREILALHRADPIAPHLEIESDAWYMLPPELRHGRVEDAITREMKWVLAELGL